MHPSSIRRARRVSGPVALAALVILGTLGDGIALERHRPRRLAPQADDYGAYPDGPPGYAPGPDYGGFTINNYGFGNYVRGADGGFGGYPAGSAGAIILRQREDRKCRIVPESC